MKTGYEMFVQETKKRNEHATRWPDTSVLKRIITWKNAGLECRWSGGGYSVFRPSIRRGFQAMISVLTWAWCGAWRGAGVRWGARGGGAWAWWGARWLGEETLGARVRFWPKKSRETNHSSWFWTACSHWSKWIVNNQSNVLILDSAISLVKIYCQ